MFIAGDVGGTKTRLALYEDQGGALTRLGFEVFDSKLAPTLAEIVRIFITKSGSPRVQGACFGIPGPVVNGEVTTTNLPWKLSERDLSSALNISNVRLVNDLAAKAAAIPYLNSEDTAVLYEGSPQREKKVFAILAPGTGTGQAYLHRHGDSIFPLQSEGGHIEFAPVDDIQIQLLKYLLKKFDRVSIERVLCGSGLVNIYQFLRDTGFAVESAELAERMRTEDPAAVIAQEGISGRYELCSKAMDIFASVLGSVAGDVALTYLATGGVYLGGGIPPKILKKLSRGTTVAAYLKKGRLSHVVQMTPLVVILDDIVTMTGLAHIASGAVKV